MQQSIQIKVEAFGAIEKLLPENLLLVCPNHSLVKDVLDEIVLLHDQKLEVLGNDKLQSQDFEKEIVTILSEEHDNDALS